MMSKVLITSSSAEVQQWCLCLSLCIAYVC